MSKLITVLDLQKYTNPSQAKNIMARLQNAGLAVTIKQIKYPCANAKGFVSDRIMTFRHVNVEEAISFYIGLLEKDKRHHVQAGGKRRLAILTQVLNSVL